MQYKKFFGLIFWVPLMLFGRVDIYDSGGPLMPEQAAYDVTYYDLNLQVFPADSSISGHVGITAKIVQPLEYFVIDLDTLLSIERIVEKIGEQGTLPRKFARETGKVWIDLESTRQVGETVSLQVYYHGRPHVAVRAPWDGGITWARTADGSPWIATACQGEGPDVWWPVKDHVSDEPDSMGIHIRVPDPLFCASNGKLMSIDRHDDNTSTYNWFVSAPINNYNVALNIGPYQLIEKQYTSTSGDVFPFKFWVLPEDYDKGLDILPQFMDHMRFFEDLLGPYPFRADKYGVVQTPHLGMEHQTIIAYGANFDTSAMLRKYWGFDVLHHHELSHEWWGNLITNADWKDLWLHEGFGAYMQALYVEHLHGMEDYHEFMSDMRNFSNINAIAPKQSVTANVIFSRPIYSKGSWVLHTLRYLIGEDNFRNALRRMIYPTPEMEQITDGSNTRFVSTKDFQQTVEKICGQDLGWFFDLYLHQPVLPRLDTELKDNMLYLNWLTPDNMPFPMPIEIRIGDMVKRIDIPANGATIELTQNNSLAIDPDSWLLFEFKDLNDANSMLDEGKLNRAGNLYKKILAYDPENKIANRMLKHIQYAATNPDEISFNRYIGTYKLNENRIYRVTESEGHFYLVSRRMNSRIYPISASRFVLRESDTIFSVKFDDEENASALVLENGSLLRQAVRIQ